MESEIEDKEKYEDKKRLKEEYKKLDRLRWRYAIALSVLTIPIASSVYLMENYPPKPKIARDYDGIQLHIQKLNDEYNSLEQIPSSFDELPKSLEKSILELQDKFSETISELHQQSDKIRENPEFKNYLTNKKDFVYKIRNFVMLPFALTGFICVGLAFRHHKKLKRVRNEMNEKFPYDWYMLIV